VEAAEHEDGGEAGIVDRARIRFDTGGKQLGEVINDDIVA